MWTSKVEENEHRSLGDISEVTGLGFGDGWILE